MPALTSTEAVESWETEIPALLRSLDATDHGASDRLSDALRAALQAALDIQGQLEGSVLHYLKLAVESHLATRKHSLRDAPRGGLAPWQVNLAKRLILERLDINISASALAKACNLSRGHFTRSFKQTVGVPPHRWLQERRIEKAKELLATDDCRLADVAVKCGFTDQAHFSRVFKLMTNYTPFSWRRIVRPKAAER